MQEEYISLAHGNGGRYMRELIERLFARHLDNPLLNTQLDAATLPAIDGELMMTTDGFTVQPLEFPGGDIGSLAIHGTANDLAVAGARPLYITLNVFIEEGFEIALLDRLIASLARAARECDIQVVAGDTKVLGKGEVNGLYLATTGIGERIIPQLDINRIQPGDKILVSGPIGDHGTAVMLAREQFGLRGDLQSDATSVQNLTECLSELSGLRFMRDPTRGGLATVMHEINQSCRLGIELIEDKIPLRDPVVAVCDMLGYDPLFLACEGRVVAFVAADQAETAMQQWRQHTNGQQAAIIGTLTTSEYVILKTAIGGERILEQLQDDPLPRIC